VVPIKADKKQPIPSCREDKESFGCLQYLLMTSPPTSHHHVPTSKVNSKRVLLPDIATGKSSLRSRKKHLSEVSKTCLENQFMPNLAVHPPPTPTVGRMKQVLAEPDLNSVLSRLTVPKRPIGSLYGPPPSPEIWVPSRHIAELSITGLFDELVQIIHEQSQWNVNALSSGAQLELESLDVLGMKRLWKLTVKIPAPSFGMVTKWKKMLLSMNFVEELILPIYFGGLTGTLFEWRSKGVPSHLQQKKFG